MGDLIPMRHKDNNPFNRDMVEWKRRAILVGELNPYGADPRYALFPYPANSAGHRLCDKVMDLPLSKYLRDYERVNLCAGTWTITTARLRAAEIKKRTKVPVVLLGAKVTEAFFGVRHPFFSTPHEQLRIIHAPTGVERIEERTYVVLPHPSGRCRVWNEEGAYERARQVLRWTGVLDRRRS